jgi:heme exporter protein A
MLSVAELACVRGTRRLFQNVSFSLSPGEALCIRGENGVGKTSLLRIVAGLSPPESGAVRWRGAAIGDVVEQYAGEVAFIGHANALKEELSAVENLHCALSLAGLDAETARIRSALEDEGLGAVADLPAQWLSQGQRRRVALARLALAAQRPLWLLDEPLAALDDAAAKRAGDRVGRHVRNGGLAVFTSHHEIELGLPFRSLDLP